MNVGEMLKLFRFPRSLLELGNDWREKIPTFL